MKPKTFLNRLAFAAIMVVIAFIIVSLAGCSEDELQPVPVCQSFERGLSASSPAVNMDIEVTEANTPFYVYIEVKGTDGILQIASGDFVEKGGGTFRHSQDLKFIDTGDVIRLAILSCEGTASGSYTVNFTRGWTGQFVGKIETDKSEMFEFTIP